MSDRDTKTALITGASRGLGAALAEALAPDYHVIAVAKTVGGLEELDDRIKAKGGQATLAPMDVTVPDAMAHLCRQIYDRWGALDVWAHTAIHPLALSPVDHIDDKHFDKAMTVNVTATKTLIQMVAPLLARPEAAALFFDDPHGGEKFFGAYAATKAAQMTLARAWAAETARLGPRVHILTPNPMPTATRARFFPGEDRDTLARPMAEADRLLRLAGLA